MCITKYGVNAMMKRIDITISEIHIKRLKTMVKKSGLTVSEIIRRAIDEYWEQFERKEVKRK
ncbi:MAG: ribbon-helix-helix protein, CopG family [Thermodesulfobacteriota bacterium]